jgi:hypothetical protein
VPGQLSATNSWILKVLVSGNRIELKAKRSKLLEGADEVIPDINRKRFRIRLYASMVNCSLHVLQGSKKFLKNSLQVCKNSAVSSIAGSNTILDCSRRIENIACAYFFDQRIHIVENSDSG